MIDIKKLNKSDVDRWVEYNNGVTYPQIGKIKSWTDKYIFVVYKCDYEWDNYNDYTAAATMPGELTIIDENYAISILEED